MKIMVSKNAKRFGIAVLATCLALVLMFNAVGYLFDWKYVSVFAAAAEVNKFEVRSELLMEAMEQVGVCRPEAAAEVWANGLEARSAALQYAVMDDELRQDFAARWEENAPNWVTGVSSPWVESYEIVRTTEPSKGSRVIELRFSTATSTGPAGDYNAILTIEQEGDFWHISKISMDEGLHVYTGF